MLIPCKSPEESYGLCHHEQGRYYTYHNNYEEAPQLSDAVLI
jgi:hypothetical protein